jgi:hypothetical protein
MGLCLLLKKVQKNEKIQRIQSSMKIVSKFSKTQKQNFMY